MALPGLAAGGDQAQEVSRPVWEEVVGSVGGAQRRGRCHLAVPLATEHAAAPQGALLAGHDAQQADARRGRAVLAEGVDEQRPGAGHPGEGLRVGAHAAAAGLTLLLAQQAREGVSKGEVVTSCLLRRPVLCLKSRTSTLLLTFLSAQNAVHWNYLSGALKTI